MAVNGENIQKIRAALYAFGGLEDLVKNDDFLEGDQVIQIGRPPHRIDILTSLTGVQWSDAWQNRREVDLDGLKVPVIGRCELIQNKKATGRTRDLADIEGLEARKDAEKG